VILLFSLLIACGGGGDAATPSAAPAATPVAAPAPAAPTPTSAAAPAPAASGDIDVAALKARVDAGGAFVLDVRTPGEFAQGHVPGAVNLPLQELKARISELEPHKGEDFPVICAVGGRSAAAVEYLRSQGYTDVVNVLGGTKAWVQAGYPTE